MSAECQHVVYAYFGGFVLLAAGALVVVFGLLATRKASNRRVDGEEPLAGLAVSRGRPERPAAADPS